MRSQRGITITELIVVIGVISILMALLLPALWRMTEKGRAVSCMSGMRNLAIAAHAYTIDKGAFLPYNDGNLSWMYLVDPYYQKARYTKTGAPTMDFLCSKSDDTGNPELIAYNIYLGWAISNTDANTKPYLKVTPTVVKSPSATFMFTDGYSRSIAKTKFTDGTGSFVYRKIRSAYNLEKHSKGANWVFIDGHGEWLTKDEALRRGGGDGGDAIPFVRPF